MGFSEIQFLAIRYSTWSVVLIDQASNLFRQTKHSVIPQSLITKSHSGHIPCSTKIKLHTYSTAVFTEKSSQTGIFQLQDISTSFQGCQLLMPGFNALLHWHSLFLTSNSRYFQSSQECFWLFKLLFTSSEKYNKIKIISWYIDRPLIPSVCILEPWLGFVVIDRNQWTLLKASCISMTHSGGRVCSWTFLVRLFIRFTCISYGRFIATRCKFNP